MPNSKKTSEATANAGKEFQTVEHFLASYEDRSMRDSELVQDLATKLCKDTNVQREVCLLVAGQIVSAWIIAGIRT